ncbi:hypothetical protein ACQEUV_01610 [Micromonospora aurantiaca (nom. illeg.)]|uniref:hypothetical protein n=1 Tax=Micromonospora aurantiaca (nom. illeg.) TaxID=47850 RepID=UPI003DA24A9E
MAVLAAALVVGCLPPPARGQFPLLASPTQGCGVPMPKGHLVGITRTPPPTRLRSGQPARPVLLDLAARITPDTCDAVEGTYDVVYHRAWSNSGGEPSMRDVVRWYADDDSGAELSQRYPPLILHPNLRRDFWPSGWLHDKNLFRAYHSTDWLRAQAHLRTSRRSEDAALMDGLATLSTWHNPDPLQRGLTARVLADTANLTAHSDTLDRAGRSGIGIATISADGHERHLIILHPSTGAVLAYEHGHLTPAGWRARSYLLLLTRTHSPHRWWEQPPTDPTAPPPPPPDRREMPRASPVVLTLAYTPCESDRQGASG